MIDKNKIPEHWQIEKLETLINYVIGGDWGKDENFDDPDYELAYCIRGSEIRNWNVEKGRTASLRKIKKSNIIKRQLQNGDILVEISGGGPEQPVGRTVLIDNSVLLFEKDIPKICTNFLRLIRPNEKVNPKFLNFYLKFFYSTGEIIKYQAGSNNLRNLKFNDYLNLDIPVPTSKEQHAIVAKIEELLSDLGNGKQQLFTAQAQLKVYRQSLLKWAFEGKLTNKDVKEGELPEGWKCVKMGEVIEKPNYGTSKKCDYTVEGKAVLRIPNIGDGFINSTDLKYANFDEKEIETYKLNEGDLLTIRSNGSVDLVGKCALISKNDENYLYAGYLIRLRPFKDKINSKFLLYCLMSHNLRLQIENKAKSTSGVNNINSEELKSLVLPHTSLEEQECIVSELESKLTVCDKLEETITQSLLQAETLKQSILKKAFEGKLLVSNEIESDIVEPVPIPIASPRVINGISTTDLHAGIIAMVIEAHEKAPQHLAKLNHVKGEKIAHLVEYKLGISLGRNPVKDAAGPDDYSHLKGVEHRADKANWFGVKKLAIGQTYYLKPGARNIINKVEATVSKEELADINKLIATFLPFSMEQAEIIATLFAGWNNLLLDGKSPTDKEIVYESRENWSTRKLTIERDRFFKALQWMKMHSYIPKGRGKMVLKSQKIKPDKKKTFKKSIGKGDL